MAWTAGIRFPLGAAIFLVYNVQTDSGAQQASYLMGTGALSPGVKRPECEADHSPPTSAGVKNGGTIPPLLHTSSWHSASLITNKENLNSKFYYGFKTELENTCFEPFGHDCTYV
jgi:hypothetical protein